MDDRELRGVIERYIHDSGHPDVIRYGEGFLEYFDAQLRSMRRSMQLGRMQGARVLDIGCGFGWHAVCMSLVGGADVVANDVRELMTRMVAQRVGALRAEGLPVRVTPLLGDICTLQEAAGSFDAIFCNETLEHVRDEQAMYRAMARLLRPGGRAVILNDNNALSLRVAQQNRALWRRRDESDEFIARLKLDRPEENRWIEPYARMRRRIIEYFRPDLAEQERERLVFATAGLTRESIGAAVARYVASGEMPTPPALAWCRNPETGEYCERLLDPYQIAEDLRTHGFRAVVRHGFTRFPFRLLDLDNSWFLSWIMFQFRAGFVVIAEKR